MQAGVSAGVLWLWLEAFLNLRMYGWKRGESRRRESVRDAKFCHRGRGAGSLSGLDVKMRDLPWREAR